MKTPPPKPESAPIIPALTASARSRRWMNISRRSLLSTPR
jgi:hypothetical protein